MLQVQIVHADHTRRLNQRIVEGMSPREQHQPLGRRRRREFFFRFPSTLQECSLSAATKPVLKRVAQVVDHENHDEKLRKT